MKPWLRWFAYINPVAYVYESLIINEVYSVATQITCTDTYLISSPESSSCARLSYHKALVMQIYYRVKEHVLWSVPK